MPRQETARECGTSMRARPLRPGVGAMQDDFLNPSMSGEQLGKVFRRNLSACLSVLLTSLCINDVAAWDLSWQPRARIVSRATDNLRSQILNRQGALGFDTGGSVIVRAVSDNWRSTITPAVNIRRFAIGEEGDAEEYEVRTSSTWNFIENAYASLNLDYIRDSTLTTELTDAGRANTVANRDTFTVSPSLAYAFDERTTANVGLLYSDVSFEKRPGIFFSDYEYRQVNAAVTHALTPVLSLSVNAFVSEFETPASGGKSLTYSGQAGGAYRYSETLSAEFGVGYSQSEIDFLTQQFDGFRVELDALTGQPALVPVFSLVQQSTVENGPVARASIVKLFEATQVQLDYSRSVSPSALGAQSISDDILLTVDRDLTDRLTATFRGSYNMRSIESESLTSARRNLNRDQMLFSGTLRYKLTEKLTLATTYRYFRNSLVDIDANAFNHTVFVALTFNGEPHFYTGL